MKSKLRGRGQRGQAMVEAALTLPLVIFCILGTLQLFMMLQARIMAQYAAFRAVRAGSVNHGDCVAMHHAAIAALVPTFASYTRADKPAGYAQVLRDHLGNSYNGPHTNRTKLTGPVIWIHRDSPDAATVLGMGNGEDLEFDTDWDPLRLEARLIYWYPLRIPFANWVMARMLQAHYGMVAYTAMNPLMATQHEANWAPGTTSGLGDRAAEFNDRITAGEYVFPIQTSYAMRMMTPAKGVFFGDTPRCQEPPY